MTKQRNPASLHKNSILMADPHKTAFPVTAVWRMNCSGYMEMMSCCHGEDGVRSRSQEVELTAQLLSLCLLKVRGHAADKKKWKTTGWNFAAVKAQYLIGGSSVHVPPQPASYWSRDSQLIGREVFCLLRVCRRKQSVSQQRNTETNLITYRSLNGKLFKLQTSASSKRKVSLKPPVGRRAGLFWFSPTNPFSHALSTPLWR